MSNPVTLSLLAVLALALLAGCGDVAEKEQRYVDSGKALAAEGNLEKAKVEFGNALQLNPKNAEARYQLALIAEREGNFGGAFKLLEAAVTEKPDHAQARAKLGLVYVARNDLAGAPTPTTRKEHTWIATPSPK